MSNNNFLSSGIDSLAAVTDGSLGLFGSTIGATNLISGFPVKVNASQQLYATNLNTSDVTGLSANLSTLNNKTQNINAGGTSSGITQISGTIIGPSYTEGVILSMPEVASIPAVPAGYGYLWSDTSNDLHFKTSAGDAVIGGSGIGFLPLAGGTMTGNIAMGGHSVTGLLSESFTGDVTLSKGGSGHDNINLGGVVGSGNSNIVLSGYVDTAVAAGSNQIVIGSQNTANSAAQYAICVGTGFTGGGGYSISIGGGRSFITNSQDSSIFIGDSGGISGVTNARGIAIGSGAAIVAVTDAIAIGSAASNSIASSCLIGNSTIANIRPNNNATCDLGTTLAQFHNVYLSNAVIGTPSITLTNGTGLPISTGVSGLGTSVASMLATFSSANIAAACTDETGSGALAFATSPTLVTPLLGVPTSGTLTNCTGLPIGTGVSGLGTSVAAMLATFSSANIAAACTDETGSGALVFATNPTIAGATFSGAIDSASALNIGTSTATSVNLGKVGIITNITGSPPSLGKFTTTSNNILSGVTTVQNLLASGVGSLAYAADSTYTGTIIRYRFTGVTSNTSPNTQTVILAVNGTSAISIVWAPGSVTNAPFTITGILAVRASGGYADMFIDTNTTGTTLTQQVNVALPTWDKTAINTLSASIQYSNASSSGIVYHSMFETMFD